MFSKRAKRDRPYFLKRIAEDLEIVPICALLGPRQCGKTTLAKEFAAKHTEEPVHYFDLEDYTDLARLEHPKILFEALSGLVIIDEIQRRPDLFPYLRVVADDEKLRFLILGSASRELLKQSAESLAGRISYIHVTPFLLEEVEGQQKTLWTRGGFPRSFLAATDRASSRWRDVYMQTYFEVDLASYGIDLAPKRMMSLWHLLAQYHGQVVNHSSMAEFLSISVATLKNYLALLEGTFMIRTLSPWHENGKKRLVKSPKLYIRDSGIYHRLLGVETYEELVLNTHRGQSWEGFALEEIVKALQLPSENIYFWSTYQGAEIDLFVRYRGKKLGFEFKCTDQPVISKSMRIAISELSLDHLFIATPIEESFPLDAENKISLLSPLHATSHVRSFLEAHGME